MNLSCCRNQVYDVNYDAHFIKHAFLHPQENQNPKGLLIGKIFKFLNQMTGLSALKFFDFETSKFL